MKKIFVLAMLFLLFCGLIFFTVSCGEDGKDGDSYISINWVYVPYWYNDSNPDTPPTIYNGQDYKSDPGTYSFNYEAWDESVWYGTYTLTIEKGEEGGFIIDGDDGDDKHFQLWLFSSGPDFYSSAKTTELDKLNEAGIRGPGKIMIDKGKDVRTNDLIFNSDSDVIIKEQRKGNMLIRIEYRKALLNCQ